MILYWLFFRFLNLVLMICVCSVLCFIVLKYLLEVRLSSMLLFWVVSVLFSYWLICLF